MRKRKIVVLLAAALLAIGVLGFAAAEIACLWEASTQKIGRETGGTIRLISTVLGEETQSTSIIQREIYEQMASLPGVSASEYGIDLFGWPVDFEAYRTLQQVEEYPNAPLLLVVGLSASDRETAFKSESMPLVSGSVTAEGAVIHEELARRNGLSLGSSITLSDGDNAIQLPVLGIFRVEHSTYDHTPAVNTENLIYVPVEAAEQLAGRDYLCSAFFQTDDPAGIHVLEAEIVSILDEMYLGDGVSVTVDTSEYNKEIRLFRASFLSAIAAMLAVLLLGGVLLVVLAWLAIRRSKAETNVLLVFFTLLYLFGAVLQVHVLSGEENSAQMVMLVSLLFGVVCAVFMVAGLLLNRRYEAESREWAFFDASNRMLEQNYRRLSEGQEEIARRAHDVTNHLQVLREMLEQPEGQASALAYLETLLDTPRVQSRRCRSGCNAVDAVINCKAEEAEALGIPFTFYTSISEALPLPPADICAVLANQLDNALEAALRVSEAEDRFVSVEIVQKERFVFFTVKNNASQDPFDSRGRLASKKQGSPGLHGLGIRNIRAVAERHDGNLANTFENGVFTSRAMMQF